MVTELQRPDRFFEIHHFFSGCLVALLGFVLMIETTKEWLAWIGGIGGAIGLLVAFDDLYQHMRRKYQPSYLSPVHRLFQSLTIWVYGLFKKK